MNRTWIVARFPGLYAQIEQRMLNLKPGRPLVVIMGTGSRAKVVSVSSSAIELGIRTGMRIDDIDCEDVVAVEATPEKYQHESQQIQSLIGEYFHAPRFIRFGYFAATWSDGRRFLRQSLEKTKQLLNMKGYHATWGIAPTMASAELASMTTKPASVTEIDSDGLLSFLEPLPLDFLYDLDRRAVEALHQMGIKTLGELSQMPDRLLRELFGSEGLSLKSIALNGIRPSTSGIWKQNRRFSGDEDAPEIVANALAGIIGLGLDHLVAIERKPRTALLTIVYSDGKKSTGRIKSGHRVHEGFWQLESMMLLNSLWKRRMRLSEIRLAFYYSRPFSRQLTLFDDEPTEERLARLAGAVRKVRLRWGGNVIRFATASPGVSVHYSGNAS